MSSRDDSPTSGDMFSEVLDLVTGFGILVLPLIIFAIPGLVLLLPLAVLAIPVAIPVALFLLIHSIRRR